MAIVTTSAADLVHYCLLEYTSGSSDKIYVIQVQHAGGNYICAGYYGRRGSTLSQVIKYKGTGLALAQAAADKLETEKRKKGYTPFSLPASGAVPGMPSTALPFKGASASASMSASAAPSGPTVQAGVLPKLASVRSGSMTDQLEELLGIEWAMQRKYDGVRCMVQIRRGEILATNRKGMPMTLSTAALGELEKLTALPDFGDNRLTVLDGELMANEYVAFDLVTLRDNDVRELSFEERYSALEELLSGFKHLLAPAWWDPVEKQAMLDQAAEQNWEGTIFVHAASPYVSGRTSSVVKNKLWASCTARVLTINSSASGEVKRSIGIGLLDEHGDEQFAGNVTVPANMDIPPLDGLVEVRYLYALEGGSLYQPVLLGGRDDKDEADTRSSIRTAPAERRAGSGIAIKATCE